MKVEHKYLYLVLAVIPLLCLIYYVSEYMVEVPYGDQWGQIPLFAKAYEGTLTFQDLWSQQCEHRPMFPRIIMISLAKVSQWKVSYEIVTNIILSIATFLLICYQIRKTRMNINDHDPCWLIPIISIIIFSLAQNRCWLWGWTMIIFLNILAVTAGIIVLANFGSKWTGFCSAVILGVVGTYSFANGLVYWIIGLFVLLFIKHRDKRDKTIRSIIWIIISIIIITTYMYSFHRNPNLPSRLLTLRLLDDYFFYVLSYLGSPLFSYNPEFAILFGLGGLFLATCLIHNLVKIRQIEFHVFVPYIALGMYAIGAGLLTGLGRVTLGLEQALESRYITTSSLFWVCNTAILYFYLTTGKSRLCQNSINAIDNSKDKPRYTDRLKKICSSGIILQAKTVSVMCAIVLLILFNAFLSAQKFKVTCSKLDSGRKALLSGKSNDIRLNYLHHNPKKIKIGIEILKKHKLSVFSDN